MVNAQSVEKQLKKLKFNFHSWGRSEARELPKILLEDEEIYEAVNGIYEGGFALLVATNVRVLLVDKKPLNYLTVEDFRFDMISEIDYNHRLFGAHISLSAGGKVLKFTSYNQPRLRKLVHHIQHCIAEGKKTESGQREDQKNHLEQINQQLQAYLLAQHQHQQQLEERLSGDDKKSKAEVTNLPKPSPELSDFLYAQSLMAQHKAGTAQQDFAEAAGGQQSKMIEAEATVAADEKPQPALPPVSAEQAQSEASPHMSELYAEGMQEVFGEDSPKKIEQSASSSKPSVKAATAPKPAKESIEASSFKIATAKLPMALRNRRFGRPLFHSHSESSTDVSRQTATESN